MRFEIKFVILMVEALKCFRHCYKLDVTIDLKTFKIIVKKKRKHHKYFIQLFKFAF